MKAMMKRIQKVLMHLSKSQARVAKVQNLSVVISTSVMEIAITTTAADVTAMAAEIAMIAVPIVSAIAVNVASAKSAKFNLQKMMFFYL